MTNRIILDGYKVYPTGDLFEDIKRIKKLPKEKQTHAGYRVFFEYISRNLSDILSSPNELTNAFNQLKIFINHRDSGQSTSDLMRWVYLKKLEEFEYIPKKIKELAKIELDNMSDSYESHKAYLAYKNIKKKPDSPPE